MTDTGGARDDSAKMQPGPASLEMGASDPNRSAADRREAQSVDEALESVGFDSDTMMSSASTEVAEIGQSILDEIRAQPLRALMTAAGIGFVAGWIAGRS